MNYQNLIPLIAIIAVAIVISLIYLRIYKKQPETTVPKKLKWAQTTSHILFWCLIFCYIGKVSCTVFYSISALIFIVSITVFLIAHKSKVPKVKVNAIAIVLATLAIDIVYALMH